ncbi:MAG: hypothetical protein ACYCOX_07380 [Acidobacteriaceae bacterium]
MEHAPRLQRFGDKTERQYWGRLRKLVPHYEAFWQLYVVPLRAPGSIWFRPDLDATVETIAITSYSTFSALGRAYEQVYSNKEGFRHIEEVYMAIQRSAELGVKLVNAFVLLERDLRHTAGTLSASQLEEFIENRLSKYRNLLHDAILPMPKEQKRRKIPKPDRIDQYRLWTRVMYHYDDDDFVFASDQVKYDFRATCSRLEDAWKSMCLRYETLHHKMPSLFVEVTPALMPMGSLVGGPPASGDIYIGSDTRHLKAAQRFQVRELPKSVRRKNRRG